MQSLTNDLGVSAKQFEVIHPFHNGRAIQHDKKCFCNAVEISRGAICKSHPEVIESRKMRKHIEMGKN
jgi:hypothetical protein